MKAAVICETSLMRPPSITKPPRMPPKATRIPATVAKSGRAPAAFGGAGSFFCGGAALAGSAIG